MKHLILLVGLILSQTLNAQVIVDSCFSSATPGTGFASSASLLNSATGDSDLIEWDGGQWIGDWPGANLTIAPPAGGPGCRAVFIGSGTAWTTGGEGFELLLDAPLVAGNNYSYDFTYISHGTGSNGNFTPEIYTNNAATLVGAVQMANLPPVGFAWTTNTYTFTATAAQAGHNYLLIHSGSGASTSSGLINNFCQSCNVPPACGNPTITAAGPFCETDGPVNLTAVDGGGTWFGTGITDANLGTFDPATAGPGTHNIIYDLTCDSDNINIVVNATDDPSFTYPQASYCLTDTDPTPNITGLAGGTFSIDNAGVINAGSGVIDLSASGTGSYVVTYLTNGPCPTSTTFNLTITTGANATISAAGPFCESDASVLLTAVDGGGTWTGTGIINGATGEFDPATAGPGTHTITYTIAGACGDTDTEDITVNADQDASFNYSSGSYCLTDPDPIANITGTTGGTFSIDNAGVINAADGTIDIGASGAGSYTVTYTTAGPCADVQTFAVNLTNGADATISATGPFCETDASVTLTAVDGGGTWTGTGITNGATGDFDPATAGPGTHTITYTIAGSCGDTDTEDIVVNATDDPSFNYPAGSYCLLDPNPIPTITGLVGGNFSIDNAGTINAGTGEIDLNASGIGSYTVTYQTNGPCPSSTTFNITIANTSDATITAAGPFCENDAAVNLIAASGGGTWSGNGITDPNLGTFDPATAGAGTHTITYTITGGCGDTDTEDIIVNASDAATISYPSNTYCDGDADPTANITGTTGGTFTISAGGVIDAGTGELDLSASGAGSFTITYSTSGPCPTVSTFNITIGAGTQPIILDAGPFCLGEGSHTLSATPVGGVWGGPGVIDTTNGLFNADTAGLGSHTITYTTTGTCGGTATTTILVDASPVITTIPDTLITYPQCVNLTVSGAETYNWTPDYNLDCNDCDDPLACPIENTEYCVIGTNLSGCRTTECVKVYVNILCGDVFVPSAFSPNNDGENDLECVYSDCIESMTFSVYNRWGEKVFETDNMDICWDGTWKGKELNSAVFVYILDAHLITGERFTKKGNISLVR